MTDRIQMVHGSGGRATGELIRDIFADAFENETLNLMEDSAVLEVPEGMRIAFTTDSFVVTPLMFRGGDIGRLAVTGTVNDLLMRGAVPKYLTCGAVLEEGLEIDVLRNVIRSMADTAREAGVSIVAGDTKVIESSGRGEIGLFINTAGIGFLSEETDISAKNAKPGDVIIVSGALGDHHAAILSARLGIENTIESDAAPLTEMVGRITGPDGEGLQVHTLRDVTRGGLGTVLKELAEASGTVFEISEEQLPVHPQVRDFCGLLGLDPLYMGNEGKMVAVVSQRDAEEVLKRIRNSRYGAEACVIGNVLEAGDADPGTVILKTPIGGRRFIDVLEGEGLPRIC